MFSNKHYVRIDEQGRIIDGWSDGPHPERDPSTGFCIREQGEYQFQLFDGGEENPPLRTETGILLYKLVDGIAVRRSKAEIDADIATLPSPGPTVEERLSAVEAAVLDIILGGTA